MRNTLEKIRKKPHEEVLEGLGLIYHVKSYKDAWTLNPEFHRCYRTPSPRAVQSPKEAGEALFSYSRFLHQDWIHLKTTNPI